MNGIIPIYKPKNYTSFDTVAIMKRLFKTKKVGHGGTLDPLAEGVLPIFIGNATRAVDFPTETKKEYVAGFELGITTDTQDITGRIIKTIPGYISRNKLIAVGRFKGEGTQIPPMYSALKINGQKLYNIARAGGEVERKPRKIMIYDINVEEYDNNKGIIRVVCGGGTYIRTLIHDIGETLECGAVMTSLIRHKSMGFSISDCLKLEEIEEIAKSGTEKLEKLLIPLEKYYACYETANLTERQTMLFWQGATLDADRINFSKIYSGLYNVKDNENKTIALGKIALSENEEHNLEVVQKFKNSKNSKI
jgi:tRNA pseudouridine55 synthase